MSSLSMYFVKIFLFYYILVATKKIMGVGLDFGFFPLPRVVTAQRKCSRPFRLNAIFEPPSINLHSNTIKIKYYNTYFWLIIVECICMFSNHATNCWEGSIAETVLFNFTIQIIWHQPRQNKWTLNRWTQIWYVGNLNRWSFLWILVWDWSGRRRVSRRKTISGADPI